MKRHNNNNKVKKIQNNNKDSFDSVDNDPFMKEMSILYRRAHAPYILDLSN